jgi:signal transduction histidine kinase
MLTNIELAGEKASLALVRDLTERKMAEEAAQEERQRLARDLHDAVSQTLWSASLIADVLPEIWQQDQEKGLERLGRLRQLTKGALAEMRALLLELRPSALVETEISELLSRLVEATGSRSGASISEYFEGDCPLPEDVHVAIYRITQEALNNATRHAEADHIEVKFLCEPNLAKLTIQDDGSGFDPRKTRLGQHLGLQIMRERAASIGAKLEIMSKPQEGTLVSFEWQGVREVGND